MSSSTTATPELSFRCIENGIDRAVWRPGFVVNVDKEDRV